MAGQLTGNLDPLAQAVRGSLATRGSALITAAILCASALLTLIPAPASARDNLGVYSNWGAFRDKETPRCYAIAKAQPSRSSRDNTPYASVGTWPDKNVRGQIHFRLSRNLTSNSKILLNIGDKSFRLTGSGGNAWARGPRMDAAILAAMRSADEMVIGGTDRRGRLFTNTYKLDGAATSMDAATVACAQLG